MPIDQNLAAIVAAAGKSEVATPSLDYINNIELWDLIEDILIGPKQIRSKGEIYLPRYPAEDLVEYKRRLSTAPWRPEFEDAVTTLASKPFGEDVALDDGASSRIKELIEDIDTLGNNLTVFLGASFLGGIAKGVHGIFVDYTKMEPRDQPYTIAEEKAAGARPYWVNLSAERMISVETKVINGREVVTHLRYKDPIIRREGWVEKLIPRIRLCEPGLWQIWELSERGQWFVAEQGVNTIADEVPLALFWTGKRMGRFRVLPPMRSLADMQIELYRGLSRKDEIETYAGSPMLKGQGISAPGPNDSPILVGPKRILFAPTPMGGGNTDWGYVEPSADNLRQLSENIKNIIDDMRRIGHQPMTQRSGGITATATAVEGAKAHSVLQAWTIKLKDASEQAMVFTSKYLKEDQNVEITIDTDFSVEPYAQAPLDALDKARKNRDLSQRTYWKGLKRFDVLSPDFDADKEEELLADEGEELEGETQIDPITGKPLNPIPSGSNISNLPPRRTA